MSENCDSTENRSGSGAQPQMSLKGNISFGCLRATGVDFSS